MYQDILNRGFRFYFDPCVCKISGSDANTILFYLSAKTAPGHDKLQQNYATKFK